MPGGKVKPPAEGLLLEGWAFEVELSRFVLPPFPLLPERTFGRGWKLGSLLPLP